MLALMIAIAILIITGTLTLTYRVSARDNSFVER